MHYEEGMFRREMRAQVLIDGKPSIGNHRNGGIESDKRYTGMMAIQIEIN